MGLSDLIAGGMDATAATELLLNVIWTIVGATLVYFMQAGFAMCEAGFTRAKNTGNILMKNMMETEHTLQTDLQKISSEKPCLIRIKDSVTKHRLYADLTN